MNKKKKIALVTLLAVAFVAVFWFAMIKGGKLIAGLVEGTSIVVFSSEITGIVIAGGLLLLIMTIIGFIISRDKNIKIKKIANGLYDSMRVFGMQTGGLVADFLLILFACMNFNKIVNLSGVHPGITMSALALGIFALSVRGIFRALQIGDLDFRIRRFLNTNKDVEYD